MVNVKTIGEIQLGLGIAIIIFVIFGTIITVNNAKHDLENTINITNSEFEKSTTVFIQKYEGLNQEYNLTTEEEAQKTLNLFFNTATLKQNHDNFIFGMQYNYTNFVYIVITCAIILLVLAIVLVLEGLTDVKIEREFKQVESEINEEKTKTETFKV